MGSARTIAHSKQVLAAAGLNSIFLSDIFQAGEETIQKQFDAINLLKGFINGDQNCTVDIYQGYNFADVSAVTKVLPAVGVNNGVLLHQKLLFVGGIAVDGTPIAFVQSAPFVVVRVTNTSGVLMTQFRFHLEAVN